MVFLMMWASSLIWFRPFRLTDFFDRFYVDMLWDDPEALTQTGILKPYGISWYEEELTDISPTATRQLAKKGRENLQLLHRYSRSAVNESGQLSYDILEWFLETNVAGEPFLFYDHPVTQLSGPHLEVPMFFASLPLETKADIDHYLIRLRQVDEKFGGLIDALAERQQNGIVAPTFILQQAMTQCNEVVATQAEENAIFLHFKLGLESLPFLEPSKRYELTDDCLSIIRDEVIPAYARLANYLLQLESTSQNIAGVWQYENGDAYYRYCLLQQTTTACDPDELYEVGKMEMARIKGELSILLPMVGIAVNNNIEEVLRKLNSKKPLTNGTDSISRGRVMQFFRSTVADIMPSVNSYFSNVPDLSTLEIKEVPENRSPSLPLVFYRPKLDEGERPARLYINTWRCDSLAEDLAKTYCHHEGIPGHHLQKTIQSRLLRLPAFRRYLPFEAFNEGWAMYAEQLAIEMSGSEDPWDRIGVLRSDLFRTARMMTDIGLHHKQWLRDQAIGFMVENGGLTVTEAEHEVDRYIVWPAQACAYKVGQMKFLELRQLAKTELGTVFDIRVFHDVVIGEGPMPLHVLEKRVMSYIEATKAEKSAP